MKPAKEMLLNLYNDNHEHKIKLEKVGEIYVKDDKLCIVCKEYDDEGLFFGYADYTMDITLNQEDIAEYDRNQYHRAIELAAQAINRHLSPLDDRFVYTQDIQHLRNIYGNYEKLIEDYITSTVYDVSEGLVEVDTSYNNIFCLGDEVSFYDLKGDKHKLRFEWLLQPDFEDLKEYLANYKKVNRLQQIDKCKDDIERYKKWILESEETIKKLEEEEDCVESQM